MPDSLSIQHHCFGDSKIFVQPNAFIRSSVDIEVEIDRNKTRKTCSDVKHRKRLYNIYTVYREMFAPPPPFHFRPFRPRCQNGRIQYSKQYLFNTSASGRNEDGVKPFAIVKGLK